MELVQILHDSCAYQTLIQTCSQNGYDHRQLLAAVMTLDSLTVSFAQAAAPAPEE